MRYQVVTKDSLFYNCVGLEVNRAEDMHQLRIEKFGDYHDSEVAKTIMNGPPHQRLYWFNKRELIEIRP